MPRFLAPAALALLSVVALLAATAAQGASADIVVGQLYAGGGNSGAAFTNDFVELFNRGGTTVDVSGWTIQYASAGATSWQATALAGSIPAGGHYLVQLASGGTAGSALPIPDATGTTNLAASGGKVALVRGSTALTCGGAVGSCSANPQVADLIGYGSASDYEGSGPAPALSNTTANLRAGSGCTDTDDNAGDFTAVAAAPRNSTSAAAPCGAVQPTGPSASQSAAVDITIEPILSIALERSSISFGSAAAGDTPASVSERVTVVSNNATGYALTLHRSAFLPSDLPLGIAGSAPAAGQIGPSLASAATAAIPVTPVADLLIGTTAARSADAGDAWPTSIGFVSPVPTVAPGHYAATLTFTVIGR
jgi:hypothetical protein